jgi:sulfoxide reductase heme-binding subunit YedZ
LKTLTQIRFVWKPLVFLACLLPLVFALGDTFNVTGSLSANPVEDLMDRAGNWGLRFIMIALAITPLRKLTGKAWLLRFRRMLGLFAFFYVLLHFLVWLILDHGAFWSDVVLWSDILEDLAERPFITLGFTAFVLLSAMAVTSFTALRRRMGKSWDKLHYSVYLVGILGVWHYWWQVKSDISEPLIYAVILTVLLGYRVATRRKANPAVRDHSSSA